MYVQVARATGSPTNVNVPLRSGDAPVDVAIDSNLLSAFPIGVQIAAHPWREDVALAMARHLEQTFGGWKKPTVV